WQTFQMAQAVHFLWPPFLFGALYRQGRRAAAQFEALAHNLPYYEVEPPGRLPAPDATSPEEKSVARKKLSRWVATDMTTSPKVRQEVKDFFLRHGVKRVAMTEGNLGCPHEEGEDFPRGGDCPFCPFWRGKHGSRAKSP